MSSVWLSLRGVSSSIWSHSIETSEKQIGRLADCQIQLLHESVSRQHAVTWRDADGSFRIRDNGSSNGTYINDTPVSATAAIFVAGDTIKLGKVLLDAVEESKIEIPTDVMIDRPTDTTSDPVGIDTIDMSMDSLSEAQLRVLRVLLKGKSEKEAAELLFLSPHTVHSHVRAIYQYYDVNSRASLMAHFIQLASSDNQDVT